MSDETKEHQLTAYLLGELSADERARVDAWLARDADARALLDELRGTIALLEGDLAAELAPELTPAQRARVAAGPAPAPRRSGSGFYIAAGITALAAGVLVAVVPGGRLTTPTGSAAAGPDAASQGALAGAGGPAAPAPDLAGADPDAPTARVELPPVPPEPAPAAAPRLPNEVVEQDLVAGVAANRYAAAQERVYVRVDKPLYRPGETIWFESLDVAARTLDATGPGTFDAALVDPRGVEVARKRIGGVAGRAHNDFELAAGAPGGEYTLRVASLDGARGERKLVVASYQPPRVKKKLEFVRKAYGAGDEVTATLELHAPTGEPIAAKTVVAAPRLDGRDLDRVEATTNADGGALVRFRLPDDVAVGDGLLTVLVDAGGVTESVSKRIPIIVKKLQLSFFPEGGDLVAGLASRVYFAAENTLGKPADMAGRVVDDHDQTVATFRSEKNGMGRFSLLPATGRRYYAVVDSPVGVTERYALPVAKEDGCVLRAYDDFDGQAPALRAGVRCATPRKVVVSAVQREQVLDVATVDAGPEREAVVALAAKNDALARAQGVARVTVFGEGLTPLAERIVYRNRRSRLGVSLSADQERYGPRDEVALEVETRDAAGAPVAATVTLSVVDDTVIAYADDKSGDLASRLLLEPELSGEVEEPNTYLDLTEAGSGSALDLLMGTKGWRRFSWVALDVASTTSAPATHAARLNRQQRGKGVVVLEEIAIEGAVAGPGAVEMPEEEDLGGVAMADAAEAQRPEPDDLLQAAVLGDAKALEEKPRDANAAMPEPPPAADPAPMARPEVVAMEKALPAEKPPFAVNKEEGKLGGGGFGQLRANADDDLERLDDGVLGLADRRRAPIAMAPVREFPLPSYSPGYAGPRTDFRDTVLWAPAVTTGADGKATVRFPLSDAVTSFRAVAEGLAGGEVGRAELVVASSLPFSMSAKVPAAVTARDAMRLPLTLTNETDAPQEVVVTADLGALLTLDDPADAERRVVLAPHSAQTLFYAARPGRGTGTSTAHFRAEAGGLGDELHQDVVVDPAGFPQTLSASGELGESGARHDLNLGDALPGTIVASVSLYPSPVASMVKGLDGMLREPSGCFEQASSTNYPNVMVMRYLESHEEAAPAVLARSKALLERGYAMLTGYETAQKGYEWFGQAPGHEALTAYGLAEFVAMKEVYGGVDDAMIDRTAAWLLARRDGRGGYQLNARALDSFGRASQGVTDAYITYSLAKAKVAGLDRELARAAEVARDTGDAYVLALSAGALLATDATRAKGEAAAGRLAALQGDDGAWKKADHSITRSGGENLWIETTALAVMALLDAGGYDQAVDRGVTWLNEHRSGYGSFGTTQATVLALEALTQYAEARRATKSPGRVTVWIDGAQVGDLSYEAGHQGALELPGLGDRLAAGVHTVELRRESGERLPYAIALSYRTLRPATAANAAVAIETRLDRASVKLGEVVRATARVTNTTTSGQPMALARVGLPGGLTFQTWQLKELVDKGTIAFYETGPREVVLYFRDLAPSAVIDVPLDLVAVVPGDYRANPSQSYLYYTDDQRVWTDGLAVAVKE